MTGESVLAAVRPLPASMVPASQLLEDPVQREGDWLSL